MAGTLGPGGRGEVTDSVRLWSGKEVLVSALGPESVGRRLSPLAVVVRTSAAAVDADTDVCSDGSGLVGSRGGKVKSGSQENGGCRSGETVLKPNFLLQDSQHSL